MGALIGQNVGRLLAFARKAIVSTRAGAASLHSDDWSTRNLRMLSQMLTAISTDSAKPFHTFFLSDSFGSARGSICLGNCVDSVNSHGWEYCFHADTLVAWPQVTQKITTTYMSKYLENILHILCLRLCPFFAFPASPCLVFSYNPTWNNANTTPADGVPLIFQSKSS